MRFTNIMLSIGYKPFHWPCIEIADNKLCVSILTIVYNMLVDFNMLYTMLFITKYNLLQQFEAHIKGLKDLLLNYFSSTYEIPLTLKACKEP